jgi:predicted N-acetyltransferase YhbS
MADRLAQARDKHSIPLSLVALEDDKPIGTVNLVENDNDERQDLTPWLAALLVVPEARGRGVGTRLVRSLVKEAAALGIPRLYLGTDMPEYYARLGASLFAEYADGYHIMTMETGV